LGIHELSLDINVAQKRVTDFSFFSGTGGLCQTNNGKVVEVNIHDFTTLVVTIKGTMKKSLAIILSLIIFSGWTWCQVSPEDYKRADNLSVLTSNKVYFSDIRPSWIENSSSFFYRRQTPEGIDYIIVDASTLKKKQAFDKQKFAASFGKITSKKIDASTLPVRNVLFSDLSGTFSFEYENYKWKCNTRDYRIDRLDSIKDITRQRPWDWGFRDETGNKPVLSPDKKWTAFIRSCNVWIRSNDDRKEYQLSTDGGIGNYYSSYMVWSRDSKKICAYRVIPAEKHYIHYVESSPADQLQPRHFSYEYQKPGDAIPQKYPQLFDAETKKHITVNDNVIPNQYSVDGIRWSRDNSYFTFEYNKRGHQLYQVIKVDAKTGELQVIINETSPTFIDYSGKLYRHDLEGSNEIIWASERDGWNHLYLFNSADGSLKNQITKGEWVVRDVVSIDEKARQIIFRASGKEPGDPYFVHCYRINFDGTGLTRLTEGDGTHTVIFSKDNKYLVDSWSKVDAPPVTVLRNGTDGSKLMDLEKADISELLKTGIRLPEPFKAIGRDGKTEIWGIIIRPINFDPSKKYPVIENIYAGPHSSFVYF
jgi:hypothetical protein